MSKLARWIEVPVSALKYAEWNYKVDDDAKMEKLVANMKRNGQVESIIVRSLGDGTFEVVNGNHRLKAMRALGWTTAVAFDASPLSLTAAKRLAAETNETQFEKDNLRFAQLLADIAKESPLADMAETLPLSETEIGGFLQVLTHDWDQYNPEPTPTPNPDEGPGVVGLDVQVTPEVAARFKETLALFQRAEEMRIGEGATPSAALAALLDAVAYSRAHPDAD